MSSENDTTLFNVVRSSNFRGKLVHINIARVVPPSIVWVTISVDFTLSTTQSALSADNKVIFASGWCRPDLHGNVKREAKCR